MLRRSRLHRASAPVLAFLLLSGAALAGGCTAPTPAATPAPAATGAATAAGAPTTAPSVTAALPVVAAPTAGATAAPPAPATSVATASPIAADTPTSGPAVPTPAASAAASPSASPVGVAADPAQRATFRAIERQVVQIRGLQARGDVPLNFLDQAGLRQFLIQSFDRDYPAVEREADQRRYEALGLLQPGQDLTALLLDLYTQQVIGLYDPDTKQMYLVGAAGPPSADEKVTFAHEYTHALQDQHFDLNALAPDHPDNLDRSLAIHSVVEGDAVLTMQLWATTGLSAQEIRSLGQDSGGDTGLAGVPPILRDELLFPYTAGFAFVSGLHARGGFAGVDAAFTTPPASTEQIMHPDKYAAREAPQEVRLPQIQPSLGGAWRQLAVNTMGEFELRTLLRQYLDSPTADAAAAGWGGDRFAVFTDGTRTALVLRTLWDSPADAQQFSAAYVASLAKRFPDARTESPAPGRHLSVADRYTVATELANEEVIIFVAPDQATLQHLEGAFSA